MAARTLHGYGALPGNSADASWALVTGASNGEHVSLDVFLQKHLQGLVVRLSTNLPPQALMLLG